MEVPTFGHTQGFNPVCVSCSEQLLFPAAFNTHNPDQYLKILGGLETLRNTNHPPVL